MARYHELLKVTARRNDAVNGWFICDRGRFTNAAVNAADRPRQARIDGRTATVDEALDAAVERVQKFVRQHGSEAVAIVGSPRMAHEGNIMAARLREVLNAGALCYFDAALDAERSMAAAARLTATNAASQDDVRRADVVALVDCALLDEAPMMALAVRQAWRGGARVYVVGKDGFDATTIGQMFEVIEVASLDDVPFAAAGHPVIVYGGHHAAQEAVLSASTGVAKLAYLFAGPNSFGCARLAAKHAAASCSDAFATGKIKGVISFEADFSAVPGIAVLVAADWQATAPLQQAEIVLPVTSWVEMDGTFVNHVGRAQGFMRVMQPGLPLKGLDPAGHPPRQHRHDAPGGDARPAHDLIAEIIRRCGGKNVEMVLGEEDDSILTTEAPEKKSCANTL
jgi:NADH-quinone oxidoreductase subunit G